MIAEAGLAALWLAAALSLLQLGLGVAALNSSPAIAGEGDQAKPGGGVLPASEEPLHHPSGGPPPPEIRGRNFLPSPPPPCYRPAPCRRTASRRRSATSRRPASPATERARPIRRWAIPASTSRSTRRASSTAAIATSASS